MASGEGVRLSRVTKWDLNLHAPRARVSTPVPETYVVVPVSDQQMAANTVGKPILYCFAHIGVNGHK
jgi:hypothetical protein